MRGKKLLILILCALVLACAVAAVWYIRSQPSAPEAQALPPVPDDGKADALRGHFEDYNAYVLGGAEAERFPAEALNNCSGCNYYDLSRADGGTTYARALTEWLLENDGDVAEILLVLDLNDAAAQQTASAVRPKIAEDANGHPASRTLTVHYAPLKLRTPAQETLIPQALDAISTAAEPLDTRTRDAESIGPLGAYLALHWQDFAEPAAQQPLDRIAECTEDVAAIRSLCETHGTALTVVLPPLSESGLARYSDQDLNAFYAALSEATDYWNFQISPLSADARYFYDATRARSAVIRMALARIYGDDSRYVPDGFGVFCKSGKHMTVQKLRKAADAAQRDHSMTVPVLMYHHFTEDPRGKATRLSPDSFAHQMELLRDEGFHPVTFADLIAYVDQGVPLPEQPVVITIDDGYLSNYTLAFPILQEMQFPATIFVIGSSIGHKEFYKDTEHRLTPHFGAEEIAEMRDSGLISFQSHTYDMHQTAAFETVRPARTNIRPFRGESEEAYTAALTEDIRLQNEAFAACGLEAPNILAFPGGKHVLISDIILASSGYRATLSIDAKRTNTIVCGLPQSLIDLGRMNISPQTTDEQLLAYLRRAAE